MKHEKWQMSRSLKPRYRVQSIYQRGNWPRALRALVQMESGMTTITLMSLSLVNFLQCDAAQTTVVISSSRNPGQVFHAKIFIECQYVERIVVTFSITFKSVNGSIDPIGETRVPKNYPILNFDRTNI